MLNHKEMAEVCVLIANHPRRTFKVFSEQARAEIMQLWRERLVQVRVTTDGLAFKLSPLGHDVAREWPEMAEV